MQCSKCKTENTEETNVCVKCGDKLSISKKQQTINHDTTAHKPISGAAFQRATSKPKNPTEVSTGFYITILIATLIFPLIGLIIGFTYLKKNYPAAKKAGKHWMIVGSVMLLIHILILTLN